MAEVYSVTTGITTPIALAAATAKTIIEIASGAQTGRFVQGSVSFDAAIPAAGIKAELVRYATTGTGTTYTPLKYNGESQNRAAVMTAKVNDTVEPGTPTPVEGWFIPNTAGQFWQMPLGREFYIPTNIIWGFRLTSAAVINCVGNILFEE